MDITSVSINPPASSSVSSVVSNAAAPFVDGVKSNLDKPVSATVTLSAQGQKLSQSQPGQTQTSLSQTNQPQTSNTVDTAATENVEPNAKEPAEATGIQFMEGESKGGRVNTYA